MLKIIGALIVVVGVVLYKIRESVYTPEERLKDYYQKKDAQP